MSRQGNTPRWSGERAYPLLGEMRLRRVLLEITPICKIAQTVRFKGETILWLPPLVIKLLQYPVPGSGVLLVLNIWHQAIPVSICIVLLYSSYKAFWQPERIAEADVCQPIGAIQPVNQQRQMVVRRTERTRIIGNFSGELCYLETQLAQQPREETVEFVAEAAPAPPHDFIEERIFLQDDWLPIMDRKILERDGQEMGFVQGL